MKLAASSIEHQKHHSTCRMLLYDHRKWTAVWIHYNLLGLQLLNLLDITQEVFHQFVHSKINIYFFYYAQFEWSLFAIYYYFHNQNISFIEQGAWKKWHFYSMGLQGAPLCACCFCACISMPCMHWSAVYRPIDKKSRCNVFFHLIS